MKDDNKTQKRIWLVGGSEGIGLALVMQLLEESYKLVISSRNAQQHPELTTLQKQNPNNLFLLDCDVTEKDSLSETSYQAWSVYDGLDIWIYNAGVYHPMKLQDWNIDAFDTMNQVNYLGAVYLMNHLLPLFTAVKNSSTTTRPQWLWNVSLASDFGLPYGGGYSAPKAALQNLAESLQPELSKAGIELKVVNHGFVKTRLTAKNDFDMLGLMEAEDAAQKIKKVLSHNRFETRFPFNLALVLGTIKRLPKSWALAITKRMLTDG